MKMTLKTTCITALLATALIAGPALAETASTTAPQQQMNGNMMGNGMMGNGMGCNGMMMQQMSPETQQNFMNQTTELRKQMMEKRFAYMEAACNPETTPADLAEI